MVTLAGCIERRILVNYRVDPEVVARLLPPPFRPQVVDGHAVAGICLLRLGSMRPRGLPGALGLRSENAAHRFAVEWDSPAGPQTGVYIPRRDTDAAVNVAVGGRWFPGEHHRADFEVAESAADLGVAFRARDGSASVDVRVRVDGTPWTSGVFADLAAASSFFERGHRGFSATADPRRFDGLALHTTAWRVEAAAVEYVRSSFFDDPIRFPAGTCVLDDALVMRGVPVTWRPMAPLTADQATCAASQSAIRVINARA